MKSRLYIALVGVLIFIVGCENFGKMKFDKAKWNEGYEIESPPPSRNKMLTDLVQNHKLKGLKYNEVIEMLGEPNTHDSTSFTYDIKVEHSGIDVVYIKYLEFDFLKDSVITAFHIEEWKKGQERK